MKRHMKRVVSLILTVALCTTMMVYVPAKSSKKYVKSISVKKKATIVVPIDKDSVTKSYKVKVKVKGKASKKFTAKSSNKSVATVKVSGKKIKVTAKKAGKAKITVKTKGKNKKKKKLSKKLTITVKKAIVTKKTVPWYSCDAPGQIKTQNKEMYFSSAYPDVAFVSDDMAITDCLKSLFYTTQAKKTKAKTGLSHSYLMPMGTTVGFDYDKQRMEFSDITSTLVVNGCMPFNVFSPVAKYNTKLYQTDSLDRYNGGDKVICTFGFDEVPMLRDGDKILIPLQTYTDLFMSFAGAFYQYNGKGVFEIDPNLSTDKDRKDYYQKYLDCKKTDKISDALAQVNYYELCNVLDLRYGLKSKHHITVFDMFFKRKGYKEKMLSGDLVEITKSEMDLACILFEDFHSTDSTQSCFLKEPVEHDTSRLSPSYLNRLYNKMQIRNYRKEMLGDVKPYERIGNTVFITFDSFTFTTVDKYYEPGYEPTPNGDTVDLFAYALRRLRNEDSDAKNVVIDLACNGGGAIYACGFAMNAICGTSNIYLNNPNTWALHQMVQQFDLNLDGKIDDDDKSMKELGFNVAVNISDSSFSCGNLLPNMLKSIDSNFLLTGGKSGGGACAVGFVSTAIGSIQQISSESQFVTMKNGQIEDIDGGISPDIPLSNTRMFDREYLIQRIDEAYKND